MLLLILNNTNAKTKLLINEAFFLERQIHAYPDEAYLACTFPFCRLSNKCLSLSTLYLQYQVNGIYVFSENRGQREDKSVDGEKSD